MNIPEAKVLGYSHIKDNTMMANVDTCPIVIGRSCNYTQIQEEPASDNEEHEEDDSGIDFKLFILLFLCCPCHVLFPPFYVRE
jgi:hypothetical protein